MAEQIMEPAYLCYELNGKTHCKPISIPRKRYGFGIYKHREADGKGYVQMIGYVENPKVRGRGPDNYIEKDYIVPLGAENIRLKIKDRVVSKST